MGLCDRQVQETGALGGKSKLSCPWANPVGALDVAFWHLDIVQLRNFFWCPFSKDSKDHTWPVILNNIYKTILHYSKFFG